MEDLTFALDEPTDRDYLYEEYESFIKEDDNENTKGFNSLRPEEVKVQNQGNTPACTCFSATHVLNGENILEDKTLGENRPQTEASVLWNQFCAIRNNYTTGSSIQTMADFFKKKGLITGYVSIKNSEADIVVKMKKALDRGMFISTGSSNGDWTKTGSTGTYTLRTDGKFVGHAWAIVDYADGYFWAINSYGDNRGKYKGYFKVPFEIVDKIYSKLIFIDKNDKGSFASLADKKKSEELIRLAKELYNNGNTEIKTYFEQIQLTKNIERLYK